MSKIIAIPEERYLKMLESYEKAMEELYRLRKLIELKEVGENVTTSEIQ